MARTCRSVVQAVGLVSGILFAVAIVARPAPAASGTIERVTLYRGQALVTRLVEVPGEVGSAELVVSGLPEHVLPDSLFAEGGEAIEVRAVRYRAHAVGEEPREEVRAIEETIRQLRQQLASANKQRELLAQRSSYLDNLEGFVAPAAKTELAHGVLNAESLQQLTLFVFQQRAEIGEAQVALDQEIQQLNEQLQLAQRQHAELANSASRTVREAVLFLDKRQGGDQRVRLSYLVNNCGWSPTYTMRGEEGEGVHVEYSALIQQQTGEDWSNVLLTLSTASPSLSAAGPGLAPFHVSLARPGASEAAQQAAQVATAFPLPVDAKALLSQAEQYRTEQRRAIIQNQASINFPENTDSSWLVNTFANQLQHLELVCDKDLIKTLQSTGDSLEGPSLSYSLDAPVSLASRDDQQMVRILQAEFPSRFYFVATPVLTTYIHREADATNNSPHDLLGGPVTVYLDGRFVGRTEIPTVARGQTFVVGFGADPQLRARRELANKSDAVQGGNRELRFTYRLQLENYKDEAARLRIYDRLPTSERSADVRITLTESSEPLSTDPLYQRREHPKGILRWDVDVAGGATGENAATVQYTYSVEYDRNYALMLAAENEGLQKEFEELQRDRSKR